MGSEGTQSVLFVILSWMVAWSSQSVQTAAAVCPVLHCFFNNDFDLTTPVELAQGHRVVRACCSCSAHPGVIVTSNRGRVARAEAAAAILSIRWLNSCTLPPIWVKLSCCVWNHSDSYRGHWLRSTCVLFCHISEQKWYYYAGGACKSPLCCLRVHHSHPDCLLLCRTTNPHRFTWPALRERLRWSRWCCPPTAQ